MALSTVHETTQGVVLKNAYIRIDEIGGSKSRLSIRVRVYNSEGSFRDGKESFSEELYSFLPSVDDDAPNFIKQGYEFLKSLPEFTGATDILEN